MEFQNRDVVITGGSSGIGKAIAKVFAREGCHVHLWARRKDVLDAALEEVRAAGRRSEQRFSSQVCDVGKLADVQSAFARLQALGARPSILVNCAGMVHPDYFEKLPVSVFETTMQVNYFGMVYATKTLLPDMIQRRDGYIVNVCSVAGLLGVFGYTAYSASKFAMRGLTEALRAEMKPYGVAVSLLCPQDTDTPQLRDEMPMKPAELRELSGAAKVMSADAVAEALLRGMRRRKSIIIPGFEGKWIDWIHRVAPSLVEWVIDRDIRKLRQASKSRRTERA